MAQIVEISSGRVQGDEHHGIHVFRGIPYAASTSGALRFAPPQPVDPWTGVRPALEFGPLAPQLPSAMEKLFGAKEAVHSEDCLSLNVFTPACDGAKRPVMVWIHGGGFTTGTGATPWYSGTSLARGGDVVVVTINYRLGALGYTALDAVAGDDFAGSANAGLLDQVAALRWVRTNIGAFGGDPGNVTIFGESAGGCAVISLLAAPEAKGLFHKAIAQSASFTQLRTRDQAAERAERLLRAARLDADQLRHAPLDRILAAQKEVSGAGTDFQAFAPSPDGLVLHDMPEAAIATGAAAGVPLVIGTTKDEMKLFALWDRTLSGLDRATLLERVRPRFDARAEEVVAVYESARPGASASDLAVAIGTDEFRIPALRAADALRRHGTAAWVYLFAWETPVMGGALGSCHALEIPFVFDNVHQAGVAMFLGDGADRADLARLMSRAWIGFARSGTPTHDELTEWPVYDDARRPTMWFDTASKVVDDPFGRERLAWYET